MPHSVQTGNQQPNRIFTTYVLSISAGQAPYDAVWEQAAGLAFWTLEKLSGYQSRGRVWRRVGNHLKLHQSLRPD